jgi:hypothetical protein
MIAFIFAKYDTGEGEARDMKKGERGHTNKERPSNFKST